ncbi:DNA-methyltransferase [Agrobacterium rosae]|uniref:Methyltransferase n=1 Tax=Agrobacterium rosae TaxID=1972867 RepID=A0A1R3TIX7_9HYPH|nr:site-specific DNA-methyltransferase [Agrobacterium rosae]SCX19769.1 DNA adenine methyltransferase YhdJ [Agrobacterium rosae]
MKIGNGAFLNGDCLDVMKDIPTGSVSAVISDLPYGSTACAWDSIIPWEPLWEGILRVCKPNAAIVLTAQQPFTTALISSKMDLYRYSWLWHKNRATSPFNAKKMPLKTFEDVCVFYRHLPTYNAQGIIKTAPKEKTRASAKPGGVYGDRDTLAGSYITDTTEWPRDILKFPNDYTKYGLPKPWHPTQKPVSLFEYMVRTYTDENELVLDVTAGAGTLAYAAELSNRRWICIERDRDYYQRGTNELKGFLESRQRLAA